MDAFYRSSQAFGQALRGFHLADKLVSSGGKGDLVAGI
jgi:hypothetical protein